MNHTKEETNKKKTSKICQLSNLHPINNCVTNS